jgi:ketosteroid isomerase-like protein
MSAQSDATTASARSGIDAGNQAWVDGIKTGNIPRIMATYADQSVDCGPAGECFTGKPAIENHMRAQLAKFGKAKSAGAKTWGSTQRGDFVYEWGQADAEFEGGQRLVDKYLTVWQKQPDGSWKIFRNLVIP